jgi:hypothetical protein
MRTVAEAPPDTITSWSGTMSGGRFTFATATWTVADPSSGIGSLTETARERLRAVIWTANVPD